MKRLFVVTLAVAATATVPLATAEARSDQAAATRKVCHRTSSSSRPYRLIAVSAAQLRAHSRHAADIVPAPRGGCPRTVLTATSGGTLFRIQMTGEAEGNAGDPVGTGEATIRLRRGEGRVCFTLEAENITLPAAGAHIHRGGLGVAGPIAVQLRAPGASGESRGCSAASRSVVAAVLGAPGRYYVNVHTTDFPAGAIRGQLRGTSEDDNGSVRSVQLTGAAECNAAGTCNLGDPDGTGTATIRIRRDAGLVCYKLRVQNVQLPTIGSHIHRGARTSSGPIVVSFEPPGTSGVSTGCTQATQALIDEIVGNPANFYVNVHSQDKPGGAVRGQLG